MLTVVTKNLNLSAESKTGISKTLTSMKTLSKFELKVQHSIQSPTKWPSFLVKLRVSLTLSFLTMLISIDYQMMIQVLQNMAESQ